ncbi:MAG: serine acetyltransferase [Actinomycetota bacterium]|nr:serine acetyltransferase [Actinomycetota bacterium]
MTGDLPGTAVSTSHLRSFLQLCREDYATHGRDATLPGFRAVVVHRFGNWRLTVEPRILRAPLTLLYRFLYRWVRNRYGIELPHCAVVGRRVCVEHQGGIVVHGSAVIGDDSTIRQGVTIGNRHLHEPHKAPVIGRRVNIGAGAVILGGIVIGDDVAVGANAVVLDDVPAGCTVVGPKAIIRQPPPTT